jgi:negative regulator of sigma E activity
MWVLLFTIAAAAAVCLSVAAVVVQDLGGKESIRG